MKRLQKGNNRKLLLLLPFNKILTDNETYKNL